MTVENVNVKNQYIANGSTTVFDYEFIIFDQSHIKVIETSPEGFKSTAVLGSDYTVSGIGNTEGGSITYLIPPTNGTKITLKLHIPLTQLVEYIINDNFPYNSHEASLDKITNILKMISEELGRSIKYDEDETGFQVILPSIPGTDKVLGIDSSGVLLWIEPSAVAASDAAGISYNHGGTGAVDRTVKSKLQEVPVNPFDYGAVGDGVTDDYAAIQAAINTGRDVLFSKGDFAYSQTLTFKAARQSISGLGYGTQLKYTGSGDAVDFDGWAGCSLSFMVVYSTTGVNGVNIQPNSGGTRFAHYWSLERVMTIGNIPDWSLTSLATTRAGFSGAGIRVEKAFYGAGNHCESSYCVGNGFHLLNQANGNSFTNCHARDNAIGVNIDGGLASNGNSWYGGNIEASIAGSVGIKIGEADRNIFSTRLEVSTGGTGTHVIIDPATATLAQENQFLGCILGGSDPSYTIGDGTGTNEVQGTFISGGKVSGTITINSDANGTHMEMSPAASSGVTLSDSGYGSIIHLDPTSTGRWYERASTSNSTADNFEVTTAGGSVEYDYNDSYVSHSFTNLANAFRMQNINAGGTQLAVMRFGAYRVWVSPTNGKMYINGADPTTHDDGTVIGTQT